jgi:hypothetical protein
MAKSPSSEVPDTILPEQFFTRTSNTPEKRLIFAVLLDAIVQLQRGEAIIADDAERWIRDEVENVPISFAQVCEILGFERHGFARGLLSYRDQSVLEAHPRSIPRTRYSTSPRRDRELAR